MKTYLLNKFENVFNDLRAFLAAQVPEKKPSSSQPTKIQEPNRPRQNSPQKTAVKKKTTTTARKERSMLDHTGVSSFKGSAYKGKGNVDSSKQTSNRKRR